MFFPVREIVFFQDFLGIGKEGLFQKCLQVFHGCRGGLLWQKEDIVGAVKVIVQDIGIVRDELLGEIDCLQYPHGKRPLPFLVDVQKDAAGFHFSTVFLIAQGLIGKDARECVTVGRVL